MSRAVARVVIESPLPQLGGEFDYLVPKELKDSVQFGCRVAVPIGRAKQLVTAFVVDLLPQSDFAKRELAQVLGPPMLTPELLECCRLAARRQVVTLGEFLRLAAPTFMPTQQISDGYEPVTELSVANKSDFFTANLPEQGNLAYLSSPLPTLVQDKLVFDWVRLFLKVALDHLNLGESTILIVPEESDFDPVIAGAAYFGIASAVAVLQDKRRAARYRDFWAARNGAARIFLGTRSAVLHPAKNLGLIGIFDDLDESLRSRSSPYIHARELALIRAQTSGARVIMAAHYRSLEVQRLVDIGYASELPSAARPPRISHFNSTERLPTEFFKLVRTALESGSALALVPNTAWSTVASCSSCQQSTRCQVCSGPAFMPGPEKVECRLCGSRILACGSCGSRNLRSGLPGAARVAAELGRAFPGTVVRDLSGDAPRTKVGKHEIVVATPSAAPRLARGYACVAVLDCSRWLSRPSLRAEQFAIRDWQEAISLVAPSGRVGLFGVPDDFGKILSVQGFLRHAALQLSELAKLKLPPAWRICRVTGPEELVSLAATGAESAGAEVVLRAPSNAAAVPSELLLRFRYQDGFKVADALHEVAIRSSLKGAAAGRRRLKIAMDDLGEL